MNPLLLVDFYKPHHNKMYPEGMTKLYSNFTPRKSRISGVDSVVVFGIQHFILEYLIKLFNAEFFGYKEWYAGKQLRQNILHKAHILDEYKKHIQIDTKHIEDLYDLGYLPIEIKALPEGTSCPIGVPLLTITNTHPDHAWLVNYLETLLSCMLWQPITSATIAREYKKILTKYAQETDASNLDFVNWQGHDFSMRGMSSVESAILSGMGHLLFFTGTDTIPAIYQLERSYDGYGLIGASVPATEHSVMCMGTKESEIETFSRLLDLYPTGILSVVSDTWDLWKVLTEYLPQLKDKILARNGTLTIRPDSGDPVDIICGYDVCYLTVEDYPIDGDELNQEVGQGRGSFEWRDKNGVFWYAKHSDNPDVLCYESKYYLYGKNGYRKNSLSEMKEVIFPATKGVVELLWDIFGGTINEQGYKVLDFHTKAIFGDSITLERAEQICERLKAKGFASTNVVFGIGSYTYQYNTRDTFGFAMKATYGEITHLCSCDELESCSVEVCDSRKCNGKTWTEAREIFKDPITDDGTKKSKKGLLQVSPTDYTLVCSDQCTWEEESKGLLQTVFKDGNLTLKTTLEEIRKRVNN